MDRVTLLARQSQSGFQDRSTERPTLAGLSTNHGLGFGASHAFHLDGIPSDFLADTISDIPEMVRFSQWPRITKWAAGGAFTTTGRHPLMMMADRNRLLQFWGLEVSKVSFGQQHVIPVIG